MGPIALSIAEYHLVVTPQLATYLLYHANLVIDPLFYSSHAVPGAK